MDPERKVFAPFYAEDILVFYHRDYEDFGTNILEGIAAANKSRLEGDISLGIRVVRDRKAKRHGQSMILTSRRLTRSHLIHSVTRFSTIPTGLESFEGHLTPAARFRVHW